MILTIVRALSSSQILLASSLIQRYLPFSWNSSGCKSKGTLKDKQCDQITILKKPPCDSFVTLCKTVACEVYILFELSS